MNEEQLVWKGRSSQLTLIDTYALSFIACLVLLGALFWFRESIGSPILWIAAAAIVVICGGIALAKWIQNRCRVYEVTTQRVKISQGVFSRHTEEMELYRVRDITLEEPFFLRLFGSGNVVLVTTDTSHPRLVLKAIPQVHALREALRTNVEICRDRKRVRLAELD